MGLDIRKIFGYLLVGIGLICMVFSFLSVRDVFTNTTKPPEIFQLNNLAFSLNSGGAGTSMEVTIPLNSEVRKIVNMLLYYMFMLFILAVGGRICTLGTQFIREIKIEMKNEE